MQRNSSISHLATLAELPSVKRSEAKLNANEADRMRALVRLDSGRAGMPMSDEELDSIKAGSVVRIVRPDSAETLTELNKALGGSVFYRPSSGFDDGRKMLCAQYRAVFAYCGFNGSLPDGTDGKTRDAVLKTFKHGRPSLRTLLYGTGGHYNYRDSISGFAATAVVKMHTSGGNIVIPDGSEAKRLGNVYAIVMSALPTATAAATAALADRAKRQAEAAAKRQAKRTEAKPTAEAKPKPKRKQKRTAAK